MLAASGGELQRYEAAEPQMGTLVRITVYAGSADDAKAAFTRGFARIAELNRVFSDYDPGSELSRLQDGASVSADLGRVLRVAQAVAAETGGAYDITAGRLTALWRLRKVPADEDLKAARAASGFTKLKLLGDRVSLRVGMRLDAGGIAKGYAAAEALRALGVTRALVAVSGDLAIGDPPPGRAGWKIEAQGRVFELSNVSVSTSGSSEQYFEAGGKRYSHIVDPRTGWPLETARSVTVIHKDGAWADALSTALTVTANKSQVVCYTPTAQACDVEHSSRQ
ncbi:MAG: FAD:protein FMN transferase [Bryobacterales bacterium]|nr:FAD:protein FMN transferase [Bryobacterales bacterium]